MSMVCQKVFFVMTPWKFNIAPENTPSQKESNLPTIIFQGYVQLRVCKLGILQSWQWRSFSFYKSSTSTNLNDAVSPDSNRTPYEISKFGADVSLRVSCFLFFLLFGRCPICLISHFLFDGF